MFSKWNKCSIIGRVSNRVQLYEFIVVGKS